MGKTVVITGASKGIGLATADRLVREGYTVIGIARTLPNEDFPGLFLPCDLSDAKQTSLMIQTIVDSHEIDALVNNVGIALPQPLETIHLETLQAVYDLNVRTAVQFAQAFCGQMKSKQWGRIINLASRSIFGSKDRTSYAAAKSALIGCTRTWALELAAFGITVNAVAPGPIETELFRQAHPVGSEQEREKLASIPMGKFGKPSDIAAAIAFLLSDDAAYITGQTICVDGGGSL